MHCSSGDKVVEPQLKISSPGRSSPYHSLPTKLSEELIRRSLAATGGQGQGGCAQGLYTWL